MTDGPETTGAIGFLSAPELLRDLFARKATGQLVVYSGETIKKIFFKNGFVIFATSTLAGDRLGEVLLAKGMVTRDQFEESASQVLATGRKQGTILVQIGALSPKDLFRGLIAQVREIVVSLFLWDTGNWRFLEGFTSQEDIVSLRLHPAGLIFEGLSCLAADRRWTPPWDLSRLEVLAAASPSLGIEEFDAPETPRRLLSLVGQGKPAAELAQLTGRDDRETVALLHGLSLLGQVEFRPLLAPAPAPVRVTLPTGDATRQLREKITSLFDRLATLSLYQLLALTPNSDADTIKRTYITLAKEYHPDRFYRPEFEDLQEKVNAIFMRINEAYTTLHNPASRAEYDRDVLHLNGPEARIPDPAQDSRLAQEQFSKGLALLNTGDVWSAIQALRWAVNLAPQNPRFHTWLGVALLRTKKRLHEAEEHCKTAIALDYNNAQYYVNLGQVYRVGHLPDKARKQFENALRLDPKHPAALKELHELDPSPTEKGLFDRFMKK